MASPERVFDLRAELDREVVAPLFKKLKPATPADGSLPEIVLRHRVSRAHERILDALVSRGSDRVPPYLYREVKDLVRRWAKESFHDGFRPVEELEIRCAREYEMALAEQSGEWEQLLAAYRTKVTAQFGWSEIPRMSDLAMRRPLNEIYVPLDLEPCPEVDRDEEAITLASKPRLAVAEALEEHRHVLVLGAPGSGKSTLVRYMAVQAVEGGLQDAIPFVLEARRLRSGTLTSRSIAEHTGCEESFAMQALKHRRSLLLIDGLDETPLGVRHRLAASFRRFTQEYPEVSVLVTSRPTDDVMEIGWQLGLLKALRLVEWDEARISTFIDKWYSAYGETEENARQGSAALKAHVIESYSFRRMAAHPLFATILCIIHRFFGGRLPGRRVSLYESCSEAFLQDWNQGARAKRSLGPDDKRWLSMLIARKLQGEQAMEISREELIRYLMDMAPQHWKHNARSTVEVFWEDSGLLVERRRGYLSFFHPTFQEYFCALDYVRGSEVDELIACFEDPWWHEVIILAANVGAQGQTILRRLLAKKKPVAVLLAARCLEESINTPLELRERIERELQKLVPPKNLPDSVRLTQLGIVVAPLLARELQNKDPQARMWALFSLGMLDYEPAIPVIARCISDSSPSLFAVEQDHVYRHLSIGGLAALILVSKSRTSSLARIAFRDTISRLSKDDAEIINKFYLEQVNSRKSLGP